MGRVSVLQDKKRVLEMNGGDGCTMTSMYIIPLNFKMVMIVTFM